MNAPWKLICLILALVLFFIAGFMGTFIPVVEPWVSKLIAAGLFFWVLSAIVS